VQLWGTIIGYLGYSHGQSQVATFEYDDKFVQSEIQISPVSMRYPPYNFTFDLLSQMSFHGLPGVFADSLPDSFGNQLIDMYMARKKIAPDQITALDRLLYVGTRGMGALEYQPAREFSRKTNHQTALDIHTLAELANQVMSHREQKDMRLFEAATMTKALRLIRVGSSAGGARSKALVARAANGKLFDGTVDHGRGFSYWLLKFDGSHNADRDKRDPRGMTRVEYIYSLIAARCDISIPKTSYICDGDDFHYLIERFDRIPGEQRLEKLHYASWAGLAHADRDTTGSYSYEQLILLARHMGLGQHEITELFRRAVFNVIGRNQDDHTKNFGFLMDKTGAWRLAPAFDLTFAYDPAGRWTRVHQIRLQNKQDDFTRADLHEFGQYCNLDTKKVDQIIDQTVEAFNQFTEVAREYEVSKILCDHITRHLRLHI